MIQYAVLLVLFIVLVVGVSIYWMYTRDKKRGAQKQTAALEMGFQLAKDVDQDLNKRIVQLHQKSKSQNLRVRNIYSRLESDCTLYLFDLLNYSGDSVTYLADGAIAVLSPSLHLPRFSIYPRIGDRNRVSGWANALLEKMAVTRMNRIVLGINPYFEKNYFLFGENEADVREFLTDYTLSYFSENRYWQIEAEGDLFTFANLESKRNIGANSQTDPRTRLQEVLNLFGLFRSNP